MEVRAEALKKMKKYNLTPLQQAILINFIEKLFFLNEKEEKEFKEIVKLFSSVIKIRENSVFNLGKKDMEKDLASAFMHSGNSLCNLTRYEEEEKEFRKAIEILERMVRNGKIELENELARAHMGLGNSLYYLTGHKEAVKQLKKAIEILICSII